ncbi:LOW QUALITY PROTEIN: hypothetical protein TorRG33x02_172580 [Trema orientale]|uniref:Uncharacterized protein n=1 Tax=Trema orientale TaxID=63057 RepID=A0A2P5EN63_TREOI|nr:LOW QUALITY PROTEIN: hypothetical protein TorRG33x02_172580 [Trema orientale]
MPSPDSSPLFLPTKQFRGKTRESAIAKPCVVVWFCSFAINFETYLQKNPPP